MAKVNKKGIFAGIAGAGLLAFGLIKAFKKPKEEDVEDTDRADEEDFETEE